MDRKHVRGTRLIRQGIECGRQSQLQQGVLYLVGGLELVDEETSPRLALSAYHNLALFFTHLGLLTLARGVMARSRRLYRVVGDPIMEARLYWLQGTVARYSGNRALAERKLRQAHEILYRLGEAGQAAEVGDELKLLEIDKTAAKEEPPAEDAREE